MKKLIFSLFIATAILLISSCGSRKDACPRVGYIDNTNQNG
jgi:hypothetical protein